MFFFVHLFFSLDLNGEREREPLLLFFFNPNIKCFGVLYLSSRQLLYCSVLFPSYNLTRDCLGEKGKYFVQDFYACNDRHSHRRPLCPSQTTTTTWTSFFFSFLLLISLLLEGFYMTRGTKLCFSFSLFIFSYTNITMTWIVKSFSFPLSVALAIHRQRRRRRSLMDVVMSSQLCVYILFHSSQRWISIFHRLTNKARKKKEEKEKKKTFFLPPVRSIIKWPELPSVCVCVYLYQVAKDVIYASLVSLI